MKRQRIATSVLSFIFISSHLPLAIAQEMNTAPAVYVSPQQVRILQQDILNQDRLNRDEEMRVKQLIEDSQALMKNDVSSSTTMSEIDAALAQYSQAINQRDRVRIESNGYKARQISNGVYESDPIYVNVIIDELEGKKKTLQDKYRDLTLLRNELAKINERLRDHNSQQDQLLIKYSENVDSLRAKLSKEQKMQLARIEASNQTLAEKNAQLDKLRQQLKNQQGKIEQLSDALSSKTSQMSDTSAQWEEATSKLKALTERLAASDAKIADYDRIIEKKNAEIAKLTEELDASKENILSLNDQVDDLTTQLQKATSSVAQEVQDKDAQIADLKKKVSLLTNDQKGFEEITKIRQQVADLKSEFDQKDQDLSRLEDLVAKLQATIGDKDKTITGNNIKIAQLKTQLAQARSQAEAYQEQVLKVDELNDKIASLEALVKEHNGSKELLVQKDAQLRAIANDRSNDQERFELAKELITKQEEQIALLQEKDRLAKIRAERLSNKVASLDATYGNLNDAKATLEARWKAQLDQANNQAVLQEAQLRDLKAKSQENAEAFSSQEQAKEQLAKRLEEVKQLLAKKEEQLNALKAELKNKNSETAQMADMLNVYQDKLKTKSDDYDVKLNEVMMTKKHQHELEKSIGDLTDQLALKEAEIKKVKEYFYALENRFADKDKDLKAKDVSLSMMQQMVDQNNAENTTKVNDLVKQVKEQQDQLSVLRKDLALAKEESANAPKAEELKKLQDDVIKANKQVADLSNQLIAKENELTTFKSQLSSQDKKSQLSIDETKRLTADITTLKEEMNRRITDIQYKDLEIKRLKEQFEIKEKTYKTQVQELTNSLKVYEVNAKKATSPEAIKALKLQLTKSQKEIDVLRNQNGDKGEELVKLRTKLAELEATATKSTVTKDQSATLNTQIKELKVQLAEALAKQDRGDLRQALKDAESEVKASREEMAQSREKIAGLNKQIAQLKAESKDLQTNSKEAEEYKAKIAALNEQLKEANKKIADAADLKADYKKLQDQLRASEESLEKNQQQLDQLKASNDQASMDKEKVAVLNKEIARLNKALENKGDSEEIKVALAKAQQEVVKLSNQLRDKQQAVQQQQVKFDQLRSDLKSAKGQVTIVTEKLTTYQRLIEELGLGNEGYLIRNGKDTSMMLREVNQRIKTVQTQLVEVTNQRDQATEQYQSMQSQLEEARSLLQACMGKVMNQQKSLTQKLDLVPASK